MIKIHSKKSLILFFIFINFWCFGIISPLIFHNDSTFIIIKPFVNQVYSTVCHQVHEKTISVDGENIFVCSRCAGIYFGLLIISYFLLLFSVKLKHSFYPVIISFIILLIDVSSAALGIYSYSKPVALLTGFLLGSTIFLFVLDQLNYPQKQIDYEK